MKPSHHFQQSKLEFCQNSTHRNRLPSLLIALMASVAILALSAAPARAQALTNWLYNPGFELGTAGWTMVSPWTWNPMNSYCGVQNTNNFVWNPNATPPANSTTHTTVHGGTNAFKIWGYSQNTYTTTDGIKETYAAAPLSTWAADGWVSTQAPDNISTNLTGVSCTSYIEVIFLDAATNATLGADYTSAVIDNTSATSTWLYRQVVDGSASTNLVAPAGTAFVRFQVRFMQPSGSYYNPHGSAYWDDVRLIRTSKPDPEITLQPASQTLVYGQTATFSVTADGLTGLSYKWQKDGADLSGPNISGTNTATLTLSSITTASAASSPGYTCRVSDNAGALTSDPASLTVLDPGIISITPTPGQTKTEGQSATISVVAAASAALSYSWQKDGNPLADPRISGTNTATLTVSSLTTGDTGNYTCLIDGSVLQTNSGLKVVSAAQLATNLLSNPGFEDGVFSVPWETAWVTFNGAVLQTTSDYYDILNLQGPVSVWAGTYVGEVYGGGNTDDGFYQNVPVTAGRTYHAGAMGYMSHYTPISGPVFIVLEVMFKDAGGATILTCEAPRFATNANMTTDTWLSLQMTNGAGSADLVAPAGAVSATVQVYQYNYAYGGGAGYFDNVYLTQAASPPPAVTITASAVGGLMNLSFPSTSGVTYEVLYTSSLASPITWHMLTTILGDGTVKATSDPIGPTSRFYRVFEHY